MYVILSVLLSFLAPQEEVWKVAVTDEVPPYVFNVEGGTGLDVKLLEFVADKMDRQLKLIDAHPAELPRGFVAGEFQSISLHGMPPEGCLATVPFTIWIDAVMANVSDDRRVEGEPVRLLSYLGGKEVMELYATQTKLENYTITEANKLSTALNVLTRRGVEAVLIERRFYDSAVEAELFPAVDDRFQVVWERPHPHALCARSQEERLTLNAILQGEEFLTYRDKLYRDFDEFGNESVD